MATQWIWPATNRKKPLSCAVGNDSTAQKLQGVGDYILILNSHTFVVLFEWNLGAL